MVIIPSEEEMLTRQARQVRVDGVSATPVEAMLELKGCYSNRFLFVFITAAF